MSNYDDWDTFANAFGGKKKKKKSDAETSTNADAQSSASNQTFGGQGRRLGVGATPQGSQTSAKSPAADSARAYYANKLKAKRNADDAASRTKQQASLKPPTTSGQISEAAKTSLPTRVAPNVKASTEVRKPVYIALMGVTGTGKSTFISHCSNRKPKIGHSLRSCTAQVSMYPVQYDSNTLVHLVDAPGFNDTVKTDADVLEEIASFLTATYEQGTKLDGILYLQRVSDTRMDGSSMKSLRTLRKICGPGFYKKIMLVTTRWEEVDKASGEEVEKELTSTNDFWGTMIRGGCKTGRHDNTKASAMKLIGTFVTTCDEPKVTLDIQKEMVDQKKELLYTNAGQEVDQRFAEEVRKAKKEVDDVKKDMLAALSEKDKDWVNQLRKQQDKASADVAKTESAYKDLRNYMQKKYEDNCRRLKEELDQLRLENKKYAATAMSTPYMSSAKASPALDRDWSQFGLRSDSSQTSSTNVASQWTPKPNVTYTPVVRTVRSPPAQETLKKKVEPQPEAWEDEVDLDLILDRLIEAGNGRRGRQAQLLTTEHHWLCKKSRKGFLSQPMLLELEAPLIIVGDIRGDFPGLFDIFRLCGYPPRTNYLFLGNYTSYGRQSLETLWTLLAYRIKYPENFFVLRGMNECARVSRISGLYDECKRRYNIELWKNAAYTFNTMPIAAVIDDKIMAMSGGLSPDLNSFDQIRRGLRPSDIPACGLFCDLVSADPDPQVWGWSENDRGASFTYGLDVISRFLSKHDLDLIVRGNELESNGYKILQDGNGKRVHVTLWSTKGYCTAGASWTVEGPETGYNNDAAVLCLDERLQIQFKTIKFEYPKGMSSKDYRQSWASYSPDEWPED